jgi:hypothetical protein
VSEFFEGFKEGVRAGANAEDVLAQAPAYLEASAGIEHRARERLWAPWPVFQTRVGADGIVETLEDLPLIPLPLFTRMYLRLCLRFNIWATARRP